MEEHLTSRIKEMGLKELEDVLVLLKVQYGLRIALAAAYDLEFGERDCSGLEAAFRERALVLGMSKKELDAILGEDDR